MWRGGKRKDHGYIRILQKDHPYCDNRGYVPRSRFVMEKKLGRYLTPKEMVHHINGIKNDDRITNLKLFPSRGGKHSAEHHWEKRRN